MRVIAGWKTGRLLVKILNETEEQMKAEKKEFEEETTEQKNARWDKQTKSARSFAKQCGINLGKIAKERSRIESEKKNRVRTQFF